MDARSFAEPFGKRANSGVIGIRSEAEIPPGLANWLDLARGLAAVEVLAFHSYQLMFLEQLPGADSDASIAYAYSALRAVSAHGGPAVMVFFVLSGYLVGGPALVRAISGNLSAIDYFSARASRLYVVLIPALVVSFCAYLIATHLAGWDVFVASREHIYGGPRLFSASVSPEVALCNGLFLQTITCVPFAANVALWSLSNEFWYYVLIFALISVRKTPAMALLIAAVLALFVIAERMDPLGSHIGAKFFLYFLIWCSGAIVYAIVAPAAVWLATLLIGLGGLYVLWMKGVIPYWLAYDFVIGLLTAVAILGLEFGEVPVPSFLRFTRELAKFSFSLYAIHFPILVFLNVMAGNKPPDFTFASLGLDVLFMLCCLAIAFTFYWCFERHTHAVRAWLRDLIRRIIAGNHVLRPATTHEAARAKRFGTGRLPTRYRRQ
jgi:peptidoglycan/LPS O-acetylase OafA/YrhL